MTKFVDANILIERWTNPAAREFCDHLHAEAYCTSVLVLSEVYHKLSIKKAKASFEYLRLLMGSMTVFDVTQEDFFNAVKNPLDIQINDKLHIAVMKRKGIKTIISYDKGLDKEKTIKREEPEEQL